MTTSTTTLTDFLLARIAEDEAVAVATRDSHDPLTWEAGDYPDTGAWGMGGPVDGPSGYESVVVDPARVLAECEAKRRIVELHDEDKVNFRDGRVTQSGLCRSCMEEGVPTEYPCPTLLVLALPYADHPEFREEWRP